MTARRCLSLAVAISLFGFANLLPAADAPTKPGAESSNAAKYDLAYKFKVGETIRSQVTHLATVETTISGTTQHTETVSKSVKAWKVTAVDKDGQMTFEHLVESIDMRTAMSGRSEVRYNSATDAKPPAGYEDAAKSVGKTLTTITIGPHGNVVKRSDPPNATPAAGAATQIVVPLPETAVAVGHVWNVPRDLDIQLEHGASKRVKTRERYELESVKHGVATIDVETQILTPIDDPKIKVQLIQKTARGKIRFDIDAGRVLGQQLDLDERVLAFSGADSSMHYLTRYTEELLGPGANPLKTGVTTIKPVDPSASKAIVSKTPPVDTTVPKAVASKPAPSDTTVPKATAPTPAPQKSSGLVDLKSVIKRSNEPTPAPEAKTAARPKTDKDSVEK